MRHRVSETAHLVMNYTATIQDTANCTMAHGVAASGVPISDYANVGPLNGFTTVTTDGAVTATRHFGRI